MHPTMNRMRRRISHDAQMPMVDARLRQAARPSSPSAASGHSLPIHTLLQLFKPVFDDDHADWRRLWIAGCAGFEHQESLAVSRHVEMPRGIWLGIFGVEQFRRTADAKRRFECTYRYSGERIRGVEIEQLAAA